MRVQLCAARETQPCERSVFEPRTRGCSLDARPTAPTLVAARHHPLVPTACPVPLNPRAASNTLSLLPVHPLRPWMHSLASRLGSPPSFHLDLTPGPPSSTLSHASSSSAAASSGSTPTRTMTPLPPVLDSPSYDPALSAAAAPPTAGLHHNHQHPHEDYDAASSATAAAAAAARIASGRAKGPPLRSSTMQDDYYAGPGEPSALTRGKAPAQHANGQWGAIGQGEHSSSSSCSLSPQPTSRERGRRTRPRAASR